MLVTCFSTARGEMNSRRPIAWLERPSAISSSTSRSLGDSRGAHVAERGELIREVVGDQLIDQLRLAQASELEPAELAYGQVDCCRRLLRGQDMPAVAGLADPRGAVDVEADEAVARAFRDESGKLGFLLRDHGEGAVEVLPVLLGLPDLVTKLVERVLLHDQPLDRGETRPRPHPSASPPTSSADLSSSTSARGARARIRNGVRERAFGS